MRTIRSRFRGNRPVYVLSGLSLLFFILFKTIPFEAATDREEMLRAAEIMAAAEKELWACREKMGTAPRGKADINRTGLIGVEMSPLTTTLGSLEAKRTTTNPNFAGLLVFLLKSAGVKRGDVIAVGASGSFPGLITAALSAAKAMDLEALFIYSLGSSQWGANEPGFDGLDMHRCLVAKGYGAGIILALTVGGEGDIGQDMNEGGRRFLSEKISQSGLNVLDEPDLGRNVAIRMRLYEDGARGRSIKAFMNIGGSWANMGMDSSVLRLKPGLIQPQDIAPSGKRGVIQEMADRGVPVIHLLNIQGLAARYGLPWDPSPLPRPGEGDIYRSDRSVRRRIFIFTGAYVLLAAGVLIFSKRPSRRLEGFYSR